MNPRLPAPASVEGLAVPASTSPAERTARRIVASGGLASNRVVVAAMTGSGRGPLRPPGALLKRLGRGLPPTGDMSNRAISAGLHPQGLQLHAAPPAAAFAASLSARAVTVGDHIALARDVHPATDDGRRVIEHELVHVAQQAPVLARNGEPESSDISDEEREMLSLAIEDLFDQADVDHALAQIEEDTPEKAVAFWDELAQDPLARAVKYRAALILQQASLTTSDQLHEHLENVEAWAESEADTIGLIGAEWLIGEPWAFPATWADRVQIHLQPPAGLETEVVIAEREAALADVIAVATRFPLSVWDGGLPVSYAIAGELRSYPFMASYADEPGTHVVYDFARAAARFIPKEVRWRLGTGWAAGKATLVTDVRTGRKTIDPASWELVAKPRIYQPDLAGLTRDAADREVSILASLGADTVDVGAYEVALAKLATFLQPLFHLDAHIGIAGRFGASMQAADEVVAQASESERIEATDRWASRNGYPDAARDLLTEQLKSNVGAIVMDIAKDVALSMIPIIGWGWRAKEAIQEAADWYHAGSSLVEARDAAASAQTVVALQRAAAGICSAELGVAAQLTAAAVSRGLAAGRKPKTADDSAPPTGATTGAPTEPTTDIATTPVGPAGHVPTPDLPGAGLPPGGRPQSVLVVGAETEAEFGYAAEVASRGHQVTVVNPLRSERAESYAKGGGSFVEKRVEDLPVTATWDLIREDFPIPLDKMWYPSKDFADARLSRLAPGGRWIVVTEKAEFADTLEAVATRPGFEVTRKEIPMAHEGAPQSAHPRDTTRYLLIFEKSAS